MKTIFYTSYFGSRKYELDKSVSIALWTPFWYKGGYYLPLQPLAEMITNFKNGSLTEEKYTDTYLNLLNLRNVTVEKIIQELPNETVFLCFEKSGFCHRHLVSNFLINTGVECVEL